VKQQQNAIDAYRHALRIKPAFAKAVAGLTVAQAGMGLRSEMMESWRTLNAIDPATAEAVKRAVIDPQ